LTSPQKIILASASPRRQGLLKALGIAFNVFVPEVEETYPDDLPLRMVPSFLSAKKAQHASTHLKFNELMIAADTVVLLDNRILGKPADEDEAVEMLRSLSGCMHEVITGVTLLTKEKEHTFSELTRVYFRPLADDMIREYVKKYQPLDKAGAYGIQEWIGFVAIEKVSGCFYNVMGLPMSRLVKELKAFGVEVMP
jgi:septum formation protein